MTDTERIISLIDKETKEELPCKVVADLDLDGEAFALITPTLPWVNIVRASRGEDKDLAEVETEDFPAIQPALNEALSKWNIKVELRVDEYVLIGDLPESLFEESDVFGIENEDGDTENFLVLAEVEREDATFLLMAPEVPALFPVKIIDGKAETLSDEEMEKVQSHFESAIDEMQQDAE